MGPQALNAPPQTDTAAWMRMLATARGADLITKDGTAAIDARPQTKRRLHLLLPVASELYYAHAYPIAQNASLQITTVLANCKDHIRTKGLQLPEKFNKSRVAERWNRTRCESEARNLLLPHSLAALRPISPELIGIQLIPQRSAWRLLRNMFNRKLSKENRRLKNIYAIRMNQKIHLGLLDQSKFQPLHQIQFVNAVLDRAPPLIRVLPTPWTAAEARDVLMETLLAPLKLPHLRTLEWPVDQLFQTEYEWLVAERLCLLQLQHRGMWAPNCTNGRSLVEYVDFMLFLLINSGFKGTSAVPCKLSCVSQSGSEPKSSRSDALASDVEPASVQRRVDSVRSVAAKRPRPDEASQTDASFKTESLTGVAAKGQRLDFSREAKESLDVDVPLRMELAEEGDDEMLAVFNMHFPAGSAANDPVDWLGVLEQVPGERGDNALLEQLSALEQPHDTDRGSATAETFQARSNAAMVERSYGGFLAPSVPLAAAGAVAALALVLLLATVIFNRGARRTPQSINCR